MIFDWLNAFFNALANAFNTFLSWLPLPEITLPMMPLVLPLRMMVMQSLLILVAIAVESTVLHWELRQPYRKSIEYATALNLLCVTVGWLFFFGFERLLPLNTKIELIRYVFFDELQLSTNFLIFLVGMVIFFSSVVIKIQGLELLEYAREEYEATPSASEDSQTLGFSSKTGFSPSRRRSVSYSASNKRFKTILFANASSYAAIALVLGIRWVAYSLE
jgi:hypothetical protein